MFFKENIFVQLFSQNPNQSSQATWNTVTLTTTRLSRRKSDMREFITHIMHLASA